MASVPYSDTAKEPGADHLAETMDFMEFMDSMDFYGFHGFYEI